MTRAFCALYELLCGMRTESVSFHEPGGPSGTYIHAFARGLAVIRAFGADAPAMTLSQVAERTGLTRANARRILLTLEQLGYVRMNDRRFFLTARILDLGFAYLSSLSLAQIAQPVLEDLASRIQQRCNVAVLDGSDIIYVLRIATKGEHEAYPMVNIGRRFPAYATAMGRVLLGTLAPDALDRVLAGGAVQQLTPHTVTDLARLREIIGEDLRNGWSFVRQEQAEITCSVGVPLRDRTGTAVAALGTGWFPRTPEEDAARRDLVLPHVLRAADEINRAMLHGHYDGGMS
jgi:IclR family pca regulon transcriptional regulator